MSDLPLVVAALADDALLGTVLELARAWAREDLGGRHAAVHVVRPPDPAFDAVLYPLATLAADRDALAAELIDAAARTVARRAGSALQRDALHTGWGGVDGFVPVFQKLGPDIVVVGASSDPHRTPGTLGSIASGLMRRGTASTLVVPNDERVSAPKVVVLGVDFMPGTPGLLAAALELAHRHDARVIPVHVGPSPELYDPAGLLGKPPGDVAARVRKEATRLFNALVEATTVPFPVARRRNELLAPIEVVDGDAPHALLAAAEAAAADVVVVGRCRLADNSGARVGRVAEATARWSSRPVLVVPPRTNEPA